MLPNKEACYRALRATQKSSGGGPVDWVSWLEFFLMIPSKQTVALAEKIGGVPQAVFSTRAVRNALRKRLAGLVAKGFVTLDGKGRGSADRKR